MISWRSDPAWRNYAARAQLRVIRRGAEDQGDSKHRGREELVGVRRPASPVARRSQPVSTRFHWIAYRPFGNVTIGQDTAACAVNHNFPICRSAKASLDKQSAGGNVTRTRAADDFAMIRARMEELRPVTRPRAADDFATIRQRLEELRRERAQVLADKHRGSVSGPRPYSVSSRPAIADKPGLSPAIRRAFLKVRTG
jgi:hypothetical protein